MSYTAAHENSALLGRIAELEQAIAALCCGDVDALVSTGGKIGFRETKSPYQGFFEAINEGGLTLDRDGLILDCNPRFSQMVDWPVEELRGCLFSDFLVPEHQEKIEHLLSQQKQASCETLLLKRKGGLLPVQFSIRPLSLEGLTMTCLVLTDLSERFQAEAALRDSERKFHSLYSSMTEGMALHEMVFDADGKPLDYLLLDVNPAFESIIGLRRQTVRGRRATEVYGTDAAPYLDIFARVATSGQSTRFETEFSPMSRSFSISAFSPGRNQFATVFEDITDRRSAEALMRRAAIVFDNCQEGILVCDGKNRILEVNPAFSRITGYAREEVLGENPKLLKSGLHDEGFYRRMWHSLSTTDSWRGEISNQRKNGEVFVELLAINAIRNQASGAVEHYTAVFSDISSLRAHAEELDHATHYDALTSLPNRRLLADRLEYALARTRREGTRLAVCYMDLDEFKPINEQHGRETGDRLLVEVSRQIQSSLRSGDTLAHLGGDEFVLLLTDLDQDQELLQVLNRVLVAVANPMAVNGVTLSLTASIGATLFPLDDADADTLLRHADQAMVRAKEEGKNRFHLFDSEYDRHIKAHREALQELTAAFEHHELVLYYQPKVNLLTGVVTGAEALIRWQHPQRGLLAPAEFLGLMDGTELEIVVGEWVIDMTLKQIDCWNAAGLGLVVSANVSPNHLQRANFADRLQGILARHPSQTAHQFELEILESAAIGDMDRAIRTLTACVEMGVRFALDDFGTGYSSLTYFRRLPVATLKIDQAFVRSMLVDMEDKSIVESVVRLAGVFNRPVIAEGMETLAHWKVLVSLGCQFGQGYGISRPMPADRMIDWIAEWNRRSDWKNLPES